MVTTSSNLTKLRKKLIPQPDGQDVLRLRTAVISSVNANGTANLTLNGASVPSVPALGSAALWAGSTVQVLSYRGSLLIIGPSGGKQVIRKSGDQNLTLNNTTVQNVTEMVFTGAANAVYMVKLLVSYTGNSAQDIKFSWSVPSGADMARWILAPQLGAADNENTSVSMIRRSPATEEGAGAPGTTNGFTTFQEDILVTMGSTAGSVQLQAAQRTAGSASPQSSVRGSSLMIVERIG
jgi:hypothetical protein